MTDILQYALSQRDELYEEIAKLDDFIRTANALVQRSGPTKNSPEPSRQEEAADEEPASEPMPNPRPWAGQQAALPSAGPEGDAGGPARRNLMRR